MQRRLNEREIDELVAEYQAGRTLAAIAADLGIHQRTVAAHLDGRGVNRRSNHPKLDEKQVHEAARRCRSGDSLATIGMALEVDATTVRRVLRRAGIALRSRRGWTP